METANKFEINIGQYYKISAPLCDDRCGAKKKSGSIYICLNTYKLEKIFSDGTVEMQCLPGESRINVDARRLRGF